MDACLEKMQAAAALGQNFVKVKIEPPSSDSSGSGERGSGAAPVPPLKREAPVIAKADPPYEQRELGGPAAKAPKRAYAVDGDAAV